MACLCDLKNDNFLTILKNDFWVPDFSLPIYHVCALLENLTDDAFA